MFERLQKKWKVNGLQLTLILCTFAIGGSLTGYAARKLMPVLGIDKGVLWVIVYIILITLLWPIAVLLISVFFGQFRFFIGYLKKIGRRMGILRQPAAGGLDTGSSLSAVGALQAAELPAVPDQLLTAHRPLPTAKLAIFASGAGSNAQKIIDHFKKSSRIRISLVVCNKPGAGVLDIAARENIPVLMLEKERFFRGDGYIPELETHGIDFIVLAGFLWKIPVTLLRNYSGHIVNIHPALLPGYGGKGMYGNKVHEAVIAAGDAESGITIHYVDELYDHGATIFQARCPVYKTDTADSLAKRIHQLEHAHYPRVIGELLSQVKNS